MAFMLSLVDFFFVMDMLHVIHGYHIHMPDIHDTIIHLVIPYMACGVTLMLPCYHGYGHADNALVICRNSCETGIFISL